jgi:Ca-activated chloride channel family protein
MGASRLGGAMNLRPTLLHPGFGLVAALVSAIGWCLGTGDCALLSPDRLGYRSFNQGDYRQAAHQFADPHWRAAALFRRGEFEQAAGLWAGSETAEGRFNHGNALLMQGRYEQAAQRYARALELRPGWIAAEENRAIALSRAKALEKEGDDMTGGMLGADEIVFSSPPSTAGSSDDETGQVDAGGGDQALREIWLRQVQTRPADFLRSKFAYQYATRAAGEAE